MKVVILGGRSGTSAMYRILRASFPDCWGHTEPPGLSDFILDNLDNRQAIREALQPLSGYSLAKCPEFAFCTFEIIDLFPRTRFIWMTRPVRERVESHINMGWHKDISERIQGNQQLQNEILATIGNYTSDEPEENDEDYFNLLARKNDVFRRTYPEKVLTVPYSNFNHQFEAVMHRAADFLNIEFNPKWREIKNIKHQAGRWTPK